jgi:hypothetical protein
MANLNAIQAFGASLAALLTNSYPDELRAGHSCQFRLVSSDELEKQTTTGNTVTIFLYRVTTEQHSRNRAQAALSGPADISLNLELHYLVSVWADNALHEQTILAWLMSFLHEHPVFDRSSLTIDAQWDSDEQIQLVQEEMSNEDLMRIWEALQPNYRLSIPYVARVIRIDPAEQGSDRPVVANRFSYLTA